MNTKITIPIAVIITAIVTAGIMYSANTESPTTSISQEPEIIYIEKQSEDLFENTNQLKKISSQEDLQNILDESNSFNGGFYDDRFLARTMAVDDGIMFEMAESSSEPSIATTKLQSGDTSYSTTNVQVENVDEPDFIKNDSKYVYIVSNNTLTIIDAYPANSSKIILKIALDVESQYIQNMFLNDDRLVIFYNAQSDKEVIPEYDFIPRRSYEQVTHALIIDVSDKENPIIVKNYSIDGHFRDARMIGDHAYFVTNSNLNHQHPRLPVILENSEFVMNPEAFYFDSIEQFSNFTTLTAIDIFGDSINSETFLMGYTGTFYVSKDNFYLTYQQNEFDYFEDFAQKRFFEVIVPLLPTELQEEIKVTSEDVSMNSSVKWSKISEILQASYNEMDKDEKEKLFENIRNAMDEYDIKIQEETRKTIIHKISIDGDDLEYIAKGSVPGRLLNQFSMDEHDDKLRVATTTEYYTQHQGTVRANAVYVLDENLVKIGELENIAPDESIFSSRFMDDRLYLVTFEQIDPFFVIDLSSDTPKILGELKLPGFSNYLHPYDEDHVIGIGRDTKQTEEGWVQQLGIKIALFNVKDVTNPIVADEVIIGDRGTNSEASYNHKSFFFDSNSNTLSIPISGSNDTLAELSMSKRIAPDYDRWNGFYVYHLDAEGFDLKGTITHSDGDDRYYGMGNARTFYIGEVLYTVSDRYLMMNSLDTLDEINSIELENTGKFIEYVR